MRKQIIAIGIVDVLFTIGMYNCCKTPCQIRNDTENRDDFKIHFACKSLFNTIGISIANEMCHSAESQICPDSMKCGINNAAYDSLFNNYFRVRYIMTIPPDSTVYTEDDTIINRSIYSGDIRYLYWKSCKSIWNKLHLKVKDSVEVTIMYGIGILFKTDSTTFLCQNPMKLEYVSPEGYTLQYAQLSNINMRQLDLNRRWNPDSLREVGRKVRAELYDEAGRLNIVDAYPTRITAARVIINGENTTQPTKLHNMPPN